MKRLVTQRLQANFCTKGRHIELNMLGARGADGVLRFGFRIMLAVVLLICFGNSALDVVPGLAGTEYDFQRGLSDKQLAMLRWMAHMAEVSACGSRPYKLP